MKIDSAQITNKLAHWDAKVRQEWGQDYPKQLSDCLTGLNVETILDCAGGTGFPAIELKQLGWDISYSDGLRESVEYFRHKKGELEIPIYQARWCELDRCIDQKFDLVLCRGNSLASNIEFRSGETLRAAADQQFMADLRGMSSVLKPGGLLFIDACTPQYARPINPIVIEDAYFEGQVLKNQLSYDSNRDVKISSYFNSKDELIWKFESFPLDSSDLKILLQSAGYENISKARTSEPDRIEAWTAQKPDA